MKVNYLKDEIRLIESKCTEIARKLVKEVGNSPYRITFCIGELPLYIERERVILEVDNKEIELGNSELTIDCFGTLGDVKSIGEEIEYKVEFIRMINNMGISKAVEKVRDAVDARYNLHKEIEELTLPYEYEEECDDRNIRGKLVIKDIEDTFKDRPVETNCGIVYVKCREGKVVVGEREININGNKTMHELIFDLDNSTVRYFENTVEKGIEEMMINFEASLDFISFADNVRTYIVDKYYAGNARILN